MTLRLPTALAARLRAGAVGFTVTAAAIAGIGHVGAEALGGSHNSDAPVNYAADHIELQDKANRVLLSGNVKITQDDLTLTAPRTIVAYTNEGSLKIQRLDATGGVVVVRGGDTATGDVAVYDFNRKIITMVGNVTLTRAHQDTLHSGRMVINLATGLSTTSGGPGGRVTGTFAAPQSSDKKPSGK